MNDLDLNSSKEIEQNEIDGENMIEQSRNIEDEEIRENYEDDEMKEDYKDEDKKKDYKDEDKKKDYKEKYVDQSIKHKNKKDNRFSKTMQNNNHQNIERKSQKQAKESSVQIKQNSEKPKGYSINNNIIRSHDQNPKSMNKVYQDVEMSDVRNEESELDQNKKKSRSSKDSKIKSQSQLVKQDNIENNKAQEQKSNKIKDPRLEKHLNEFENFIKELSKLEIKNPTHSKQMAEEEICKGNFSKASNILKDTEKNRGNKYSYAIPYLRAITMISNNQNEKG